MAYAFQTLAAAVTRARMMARRRRQPVSILQAGYDYELWTESQIEDGFASGDLTEFEYRRDHVRTVRG